jgi:Flp pilus assembly protein TadG
MFDRAFGKIQAFRHNWNGNAAMMFCLAAIPFFGILGFATDYGLALADKAKLDGATDAASLAAIRVAQSAIQSGASRASAMAAGSAQALTTFRANAGSLAFGTAPTPTFQWTSGASGQTLAFKASYSMTMTNALSRIIGYKTTTVAGNAAATLTMPTYINYYFLVDISQSMGVGATPADMQTLYDRVIKYNNFDNAGSKAANVGCVFGCHVPEAYQSISNETLAHDTTYGATPVVLRIDSAKAAIQAVLTDAQAANTAAGANLVQIAVYTMQQDPQTANSYIQKVSDPLSSNFTSFVSPNVDKMDLGNNNAGGTGDTGFSNSLNSFVTNYLSTQGDGSSPSSALNYVFLITDGLSDTPSPYCTSGHCTGAFDDSLCTPLKAKATVGAIYTTYNPIYYKNNPSLGYDGNYAALAAPYVTNIPKNLQACTSDPTRWYYEASDGPGITTGMKKLFAGSSTLARLTQ